MAYTEYRVTKHGERAKLLRKQAGAYIKGLRTDKGFTQQEVAKRLGMEYYTWVSQWETGLSRVPPETQPALAKVLGIAPEEFTKNLLKFYDPFTYEALFCGNKKGSK